MKILKKTGIIILVLLSLFVTHKVYAEEGSKINDGKELEKFVDKQMTDDLKEYHIPGAVISIVKDQKIVYSQGYGFANIPDKQKVTAEDSMFRIASTTKLFTWTAVMQLVEQGKLDLDTDINTYLTSLKIPETFKDPITMRHLMTHTAGFEEGGVGYQITTDKERLKTTIAETLKKHPLARIRPVGELASYSNYGAALAGLVVEDISGMSYADYIQKNIFEPLNMTYATVKEPLPKEFKHNEVIGYNFKEGEFTAGTPTYEGGFSPAGAGSVSGNDMAQFMIAHLNGGMSNGQSILKPETVRLMQKTAFRFDDRLPGSGLGFQEGEMNGQKIVSHAGADTMFITDLFLIPSQKIGVFISYSGGDGDGALASFKENFFNNYFPINQEKAPKFIDTTEEELAKYTGSYKFSRRNYSHIDKFYSLLAEMKVSQVDGQLSIGQGDEEERFKKIDQDLFQQIDGQHQLVFKKNKKGEATQMLISFIPDMTLEKTKFWDQSVVWLSLLGTSAIIMVMTIILFLIKLIKIKQLSRSERISMWVILATSVSSIVTLILTVTQVLNMDVLQRLSELTLGLKLFLCLPLLVIVLTVMLLVRVVKIWYCKEFNVPIRIFVLFIGLAAITICLFFAYWNLVGWNFG